MSDAGWYPDPTDRHQLRWWDGENWTEHVSDAGVVGVDPLGGPPAPSAAPTLALPVTPATPAGTPGGLAPPTPPAPAEPAPLPAAAPAIVPVRRRPHPAVVAGGAIATLVLLLVVVLAVRGGDDESVSPDGSLAPSSTTEQGGTSTVPPTTVETTSTSTPDTAAADPATSTTTSESAPASSTVSVPTNAPSSSSGDGASPWPTAQELASVLPRPADLPPSWVGTGAQPLLDPEPDTGPRIGWCGGDNDAARAEAFGAAAMVVSDRYTTRPGGWFQMSVITFRDVVPASLFLTATGEQVLRCEGGVEYPVAEGAGPGEYDGFSGAFGAGTVWSFYEVGAATYETAPGADEALRLVVNTAYAADVGGVEYRGVLLDVVQLEHVGPHVIIWHLRGDCCIAGFTDREPGYDYPAIDVLPDLLATADSLRAGVLGRLASL